MSAPSGYCPKGSRLLADPANGGRWPELGGRRLTLLASRSCQLG